MLVATRAKESLDKVHYVILACSSLLTNKIECNFVSADYSYLNYLLSCIATTHYRQNKIVQLPDNLELMASLQVLSLSSNLLEELPDAVASLHSLRQLFANGNRIKKVPENLCLLPELKVRPLFRTLGRIWTLLYYNMLLKQLVHELLLHKFDPNWCHLQEVNLSNNQLNELPPLWESIWGSVDPATGLLTVTVTVTATADKEKDNKESKGAKVLLLGNPLLTAAA